ncbi:CPS_collapsed_G0030670.mRNA.1.CDS.1 [Saccharomyces cerevisiae]|nr:CPS_collapsed_G0030670.mRNA.1.CDS.1 [Saccharomyces cerevisiae]
MEIGGDRVTVFKQEQGEISRTSTIILRGATQNNLDDIERAIDDGVAAVKGLMKPSGGKLLPGAGATEIELISRITKYGERTPGLLQLAIKQFAVAFEVVPQAATTVLSIDQIIMAKKAGGPRAPQGPRPGNWDQED